MKKEGGNKLGTFFLSVLLLGLVFLVTNSEQVNASIDNMTITSPAASAIVPTGSTTYSILVRFGSQSENNSINATYYYRTGTTGAWTLAKSALNVTTVLDTYNYINTTLDLSSASLDSSTFQINVSLANTSNTLSYLIKQSSTVTGLMVDNTAPTGYLNIFNQNPQSGTAPSPIFEEITTNTIVAAQSLQNYVIYPPNVGNSFNATISNNQGTLTTDQYITKGIYNVEAWVNDSTGNVLKTNGTFTVGTKSSLVTSVALQEAKTQEQTQEAQQKQAQNNNIYWFVGIISVLGILGIVGWLTGIFKSL